MIVIGLGFGDEGKGLTTGYLCNKSDNPLVIRFNGGHQAGHTVVHDNKRHVFSSFGSGTLHGAPSYISHYCTINPTAIVNEYHALREKGIFPQLGIHPLCPVTTPYDIDANQKSEDKKGSQRHGSVGVGFGATIQRQEDFYKLYAQDLQYPEIVKAKLDNISKYYGIFGLDTTQFLKDVDEMLNIVGFQSYEDLRDHEFDYIFEGAQGVLLDQDFGFFPNVTRSNTTSKNAIKLFKLLVGENITPDIYYITRTYQTRHGAGFMSNEDPKLPLVNNEYETNVSHKYQGDFRVGELDVNLLNYAIECDSNFSENANRHLVVTCMDQLPIKIDVLKKALNWEFKTILESHSPSSNKIKEWTKTKAKKPV